MISGPQLPPKNKKTPKKITKNTKKRQQPEESVYNQNNKSNIDYIATHDTA